MKTANSPKFPSKTPQVTAPMKPAKTQPQRPARNTPVKKGGGRGQ